MELSSGRLLDEIQNSYQSSIEVDVNIKHLNATPVGQEVTATFIRQEGLLYKFKVDAFDNEGKIGEGFHKTAIIEIDRLVSDAERRIINNK